MAFCIYQIIFKISFVKKKIGKVEDGDVDIYFYN